jgi:hypothetical protein
MRASAYDSFNVVDFRMIIAAAASNAEMVLTYWHLISSEVLKEVRVSMVEVQVKY